VDVDYVPDRNSVEHRKLLSKYKIKVKQKSSTTADITGTQKNLIGFMTDAGYEDLKDVYPELYEDEVEEQKKKMKESLNILISSDETLSEEFKSKATILFEAALSERLVDEKQKLKEAYQVELQEEVANVYEHLSVKVNDYIGYVVESWIEENKVGLDKSLKTEITESFMEDLKNLFVEKYIEVPEEKRDYVDELETKLSIAESSLSETTEQAEKLAEGVIKLKREATFARLSEGLVDTQAEKLKNLVEDLEFVDEKSFASKIETIKESVFSVKPAATKTLTESAKGKTEFIVEGDETPEQIKPNPRTALYVKALSKS
jgi:negative regulator of replication initiation